MKARELIKKIEDIVEKIGNIEVIMLDQIKDPMTIVRLDVGTDGSENFIILETEYK